MKLLTEHDAGTRTMLRSGEQFTIQLAENATTGYQWVLTVVDTSCLRLVQDGFVPRGEEGAVGAEGQRSFTFEAVRPGTTTLDLRYYQPWEGEASAARQLRYTVEVVE